MVDLTNCVSWLRFNNSPTDDFFTQNNWTVSGNPTIGTDNAINGNALQLDGNSFLKLSSLELGGQDFTVDGWLSVSYVDICYVINIKKTDDDSKSLAIGISDNMLPCNLYFSFAGGVSSVELGEGTSIFLNSRTHFRLIYRHSQKSFEAYVDGVFIGSATFGFTYPRGNYIVQVGAEDFTGSIDEFMIFDGVALGDSATNFTPPTAAYYNSFNTSFLVDTKRIVVQNKQTRWIYKNYGTADLLTVAGTTVTNLPADKSKTGSAFYQTNRAKCFDIPSTKEIWIRCDINVVANVTSSRIRIYNDPDQSIFNGWSTYDKNITKNYFYWINGTSYDGGYRISRNDEGYGKQPFLLHMKSGVTDGFLEFYFHSKSNKTYRSFTGNVNNGNDFDNVYIQMDGSNIYVSNLIISNEPLEISDDVYNYVNFNLDTLRIITGGEVYFLCDTLRNVVNPVNLQADTRRDIVRSEIVNVDTARNVIKSLQADCDTCRNVIRSENFLVDTLRKLPHTFNIFPVDSSTVVIDTSDVSPGLQSFSVAVAAQQLTDTVSFSGIIPVAILDQIKGKYLDYNFNVRIERLKSQGIIYSAVCCSDIDELLYTKIRYKIPNEDCYTRIYDNDSETWQKNFRLGTSTKTEFKGKAIGGKISSANIHAQTIAAVLGKQPALFFDDFISTADPEPQGGTYQDAIDNIFGWTSRIPHKMINVFIRADKFFVVQRGFEPNVIDLSDTKHTLPIYNYELVRTSFGGEPNDKTIVTEKRFYNTSYYGDLIESDDDDDEPQEDQPSEGNQKSPDGLVESTTITEGNVTTTTTYTYDNDGQVIKCTTTISSPDGTSRTETSYNYKITDGGRKVLEKEIVKEYEGGELIDTRITAHNYLEQGQTHTVSFSDDGSYLGGNVGANRGDDRRSTLDYHFYTYDENGKKHWHTGYKFTPSISTESKTIRGVSMIDSSFPVHGDDKLAEITADINWLNRKVKETVSMTIYDYPHFIDFTDRIIFNGNTYFLESNKAVTNDRIINQQNVSFSRWYGA